MGYVLDWYSFIPGFRKSFYSSIVVGWNVKMIGISWLRQYCGIAGSISGPHIMEEQKKPSVREIMHKF
jgi:hypothetical protein